MLAMYTPWIIASLLDDLPATRFRGDTSRKTCRGNTIRVITPFSTHYTASNSPSIPRIAESAPSGLPSPGHVSQQRFLDSCCIQLVWDSPQSGRAGRRRIQSYPRLEPVEKTLFPLSTNHVCLNAALVALGWILWRRGSSRPQHKNFCMCPSVAKPDLACFVRAEPPSSLDR